jgi:electron transfer flavoprotein alpha/beta subunit
MKIAVCFKTLADYRMLTEEDWRVDRQRMVDLHWVRQIYNCYEESALELALQLRDGLPEASQGEVSALTIDNACADLFLKGLFAVGYDHGIRIDSGEMDLRFNPAAVSLLLASSIRRLGGGQLLLLGAQGGAGDNRQTGFLVAERLGWPCIHDVTDVTLDASPGFLRVTSRRHGAVLIQTVRLPLVLVVGNVLRCPYLRVPTIKNKLAAKKKSVTVLTTADLAPDSGNPEENDLALVGLFRKTQERHCHILAGETAREKASILYHRFLAERL